MIVDVELENKEELLQEIELFIEDHKENVPEVVIEQFYFIQNNYEVMPERTFYEKIIELARDLGPAIIGILIKYLN